MPQYESQFEENLYQLRRDKLQQIADIIRAQDPTLSDIEAKYPNTFRFQTTIPELRKQGDPLSTEDLEAQSIETAIAGRIMAIRVQGKAGFATLQQGGERLQIYVRKDDVGEPLFNLYKLLDLGDHIGVRGTLMRTRTGELTLKALPSPTGPAITFLTKAMLALPDKFHGLSDIELRYRQRYVDLIMNSAPSPAFAAETPATAPPTTDVSSRPESASSADAAERPASPAVAQSQPEPNVRATFVKRAAILRAIRTFFDTRGYLEVETPMLHTIVGGATARPFATHHNALDIDLSLRIAPELYLKRLVVGGFDRVYEINRNFRNEGVSTQHNPEFTMLEFYQAYANYHDLIGLTQELITFVANEVNGTTITTFPLPKGPSRGEIVEIDLGKWETLSMREAIIKFWGGPDGTEPTLGTFDSVEAMANWIKSFNLPDSLGFFTSPNDALRATDYSTQLAEFAQNQHGEHQGPGPDNLTRFGFYVMTAAYEYARVADGVQSLGKGIASIFEAVAEHHLIQPTIIYDFPLAVSPLSKVKPNEPDWVERFEFYIGGFEVGNAFSELNDPDDQLRRFQAQLEDRARGDEEAMAEVDEDYVRALGIGLPPTAGEGIGIDRLTMILTGSSSIRDVILFPLMRPHKPTPEQPQPHGESAE